MSYDFEMKLFEYEYSISNNKSERKEIIVDGGSDSKLFRDLVYFTAIKIAKKNACRAIINYIITL